MNLHNTARVDAGPEAVFALLGDPERVVGCLPGATLTGRDGEAWAGAVTVRVGPVTVAYTGTVRFEEVDAASGSMRLVARGRDSRGSGDAEADVRVQVRPDGAGSVLDIDTDLLVRGKLAQFGKGAIATVSDRILDQFAGNLGALAAGRDTPADAPAAAVTAAGAVGTVGSVAAGAVPAPAPRGELDSWAVVIRPLIRTHGPRAALIAAALVQGYVVGRAVTIERYHRRR